MNEAMAWWIVDQLVQQGVRHFVIAPGSRNTPLVMAVAHHPKAIAHVHYDERGAGFFALGIGKGGQMPAAVIATSGTAVGNLLPSVMEARHSFAPLLLLTADRPPELIDAGANQATDQLKIFQNFTRGQIYLPTSGKEVSENYVRSSVAHGVCLSLATPGPVQINWHIRDPLFTPPFPKLAEGAKIDLHLSKRLPSTSPCLRGNGAIAIGRLPSKSDLGPILALAERLRWPVFGDILSNARLHPTYEQIRHFDWIFKGDPPKADMVLQFGDRMTSKKYLEWAKEARVIHVSPWTDLQDPGRYLSQRVLSDPAAFCEAAEWVPADGEWLALWRELDAEIESETAKALKSSPLCTEAHAFDALSKCFDREWSIYLGSGMPIRDADHFFFPEQLKGIFANRGLSGIDGNIATASGLSIALQSPVAAFIGDQAALHDLNSLPLIAKANVMLVISNNFGSGIFSHLPIAKGAAPDHFERFFANAHTLQFEEAAKMFRLPYFKAESISELIQAWKKGRGSSGIIELITSRKTNYEFQQELTQSCSHVGV
ncbi:MAG: 2-succinyl-5-enolpyruvyl-6-hydroxy-3-cyclohexene-1-carboxylic-acid synthase [Verrucomicrobia bacterium]|nr:2-succinyl-5-enolpyruvyl-6-hydroxy-3-cyclohexene-1-carboxylic-acid synthase [Verrucomicrobiota bacterium]